MTPNDSVYGTIDVRDGTDVGGLTVELWDAAADVPEVGVPYRTLSDVPGVVRRRLGDAPVASVETDDDGRFDVDVDEPAGDRYHVRVFENRTFLGSVDVRNDGSGRGNGTGNQQGGHGGQGGQSSQQNPCRRSPGGARRASRPRSGSATVRRTIRSRGRTTRLSWSPRSVRSATRPCGPRRRRGGFPRAPRPPRSRRTSGPRRRRSRRTPTSPSRRFGTPRCSSSGAGSAACPRPRCRPRRSHRWAASSGRPSRGRPPRATVRPATPYRRGPPVLPPP